MAVTIPPAWEMAVATAPTTPWSGAVCRRMVIEYDEVVAAMAMTFLPARGYQQVRSRLRRCDPRDDSRKRAPVGQGLADLLRGQVGEQVLGEPLAHLVDHGAH